MIRLVIFNDSGAEVEVGDLTEDEREDVAALCEHTLSECADVDAREAKQAELDDKARWGFDWGLDDDR
jgi:hypothetical protein